MQEDNTGSNRGLAHFNSTDVFPTPSDVISTSSFAALVEDNVSSSELPLLSVCGGTTVKLTAIAMERITNRRHDSRQNI
jgi:hypothetical protein